MVPGLILWLLGVPLGIVVLLWLFGVIGIGSIGDCLGKQGYQLPGQTSVFCL